MEEVLLLCRTENWALHTTSEPNYYLSNPGEELSVVKPHASLILGFCILLCMLYQGYQENRPSQQPFKAFIVFILRPLHESAFTGHHQVEHNIIHKEVIILTTDPLSAVQIVLCTLFDKCCRRLLKCDCEVSTRACNHFVF
jgi:hypothetical protein